MEAIVKSLRQRVNQALSDQKPQTVTVLSCLLAAQDELGYIAREAIEEVARFTDTTVNDVWGVASFYTNFQFTPPGRHRVEVCWGPTCHILGAMDVIDGVLKDIGLHGEGITADGSISLRFNTCLGACANGPVMSVDHKLIGRLCSDDAVKVIHKLSGNEDDK